MHDLSRLFAKFAHLFPLAALAFAPSACGTSDDAPKRGGGESADAGQGGEGNEEGDGGLVDGDTGDNDGGGKTVYTLGEVCDVLAEKQCEALRGCCESTGVGYDQTGCREGVKKGCELRAAKVAAGKLSFDGSSVDACNAAMAALYSKCEVSWAETADTLLGVKACRDVFAGTKAEGEACASTDECKPPSDASRIAVCEGSECAVRVRFLGEGDPCTIGGSIACAGHLYCDAASTTEGSPGTCAAIKAIGEACDKRQEAAAKLECGWGNHCQPSQGQCIAGKASGESCTESTFYECTSYTCTGGKCAPLAVANSTVCKGASASL